VNSNPASSPSFPRLQTKADTSKASTKTPTQAVKNAYMPSGKIVPRNTLSGNKTSTGPHSSPTPSRIAGAALPTKLEEAEAVAPRRSNPRGRSGPGGQHPAHRTNPKRAVKTKSREASATIGSDNDVDELNLSEYNIPRTEAAEDRRQVLKRKDSREKDRLRHEGQIPINLEEEE